MFESIQKTKKRKPLLATKPSAETHWDGFIDKTFCANIIMGNLCKTLERLLSKGGSDYDMLSTEQKLEDDISEFTYTELDKLTLANSKVLLLLPSISASFFRTIVMPELMYSLSHA